MRVNLRQEPRHPTKDIYSICWDDASGLTHSTEVQSIDSSRCGLGFQCLVELRPGQQVFVQKQGGATLGYATVRYRTRRDSTYRIGIELSDEAKNQHTTSFEGVIDYYDFLQISPKAEFETIQRVYRFLAARYHPDNPGTGDVEKFLLLTQAFDVLSDPERRASYDSTRTGDDVQPSPSLGSVDYMDGIEGEVNRRLAVLSLLYTKRRSCPDAPRVPLIDLEKRMGFPREYLDFATWYLRSKKYITREDNSDFALTALGVDFVEANASKIPVLHKMLTDASWHPGGPRKREAESEDRTVAVELPPGPAPAEIEAPSAPLVKTDGMIN